MDILSELTFMVLHFLPLLVVILVCMLVLYAIAWVGLHLLHVLGLYPKPKPLQHNPTYIPPQQMPPTNLGQYGHNGYTASVRNTLGED